MIHTYIKDLFFSMSVIIFYHHVGFSRKCLKDHKKTGHIFIQYVYLQWSSEDAHHLPKLYPFYQIEAPI